MYALVLATALTTGGVAPQYSYSCWGCSGSYNACWYTGYCDYCPYCGYGSWGGGFGYAPAGYGGGYGGYGWGAPMPLAGVGGSPGEPDKKIEGKPGETRTPVEPTRARLHLEVPAEARLYINGRLMRTASAVRAFDTPPLEPGRAYSYTLRAEVVRGGKTVSDTREVEVRAGAVTKAALLVPATRLAAAPP
jgi:uncharacterized protein (TIGR03000 family)